MVRLLFICIILSAVGTSCESVPHGSNRFKGDNLTIGEYLRQNQDQYSKSYSLLLAGELVNTLSGYNPHGEGYTLFLPTDEAVDHFIEHNENYENFEEIFLDSNYIIFLTRYHVVNSQVHTNDFPFGALKAETLTGDRLTVGFYTDGEGAIYKINDVAPIVKSNLEMTNGYIHVISDVLQKVEYSGYDWIQQKDDHSILAQAMELTGIEKKLWKEYTILAEHDSIYHKKGILSIEDLTNRIATPGIPYTDSENSLYQFAAYHILKNDIYLNDLDYGSEDYRTLADERVIIDVGLEIRINPGLDTFQIEISESGDTTVFNYIQLLLDDCNILTRTGPVHLISDVLDVESFLDEN